VAELKETADRSQAPLKAILEGRQRRSQVTGYQPFYIVNVIAVEADLDTVLELAGRDDVERIAASYPLLRLWDEPVLHADADESSGAVDDYPWGITKIGADRVWRELGITGEGAVVGGFDTGVNYRHPALARAYRGIDANGLYSHDYNWFEPGPQLYPNGNLGPSHSNVPYDCDYDSHGTHTMGTMVGDGGTEDTAVGVAPDARWIAVPGICRETMPGTGLADDIGGIKAFQWFLCPTDLSGDLATADCSRAPHVINNSWGSANPVSDVFQPAIAALRAAGTTVVFAAGNTGRAGSIGSPGHLPETITVGATTSLDGLAYFSSRGPAFQGLELKPNLSAPGEYVLSSTGSSGYSSYSGTSMAAPHVAGLIALLVSADLADGERNLNADELEAFVTNTTVDLGAIGPDVEYGQGRIDAYKAVRWVLAAGDLRGQIRDGQSGAPIANVHIRGDDLRTGESFTGMTDASGAYSLTVPAALYQLTLSAWGYETGTFANQRVLAGALSIANLDLNPIPLHPLTGTLRRDSTPVAGAHLYIKENPAVQTTSSADGDFSWSLPPGQHTIVVEANGHRRLEKIVNLPTDGASLTLQLERAPTILLVNADASAGWFYGWPVHPFMAWALDQHGYLYDLWSIDYTHFVDQRTFADGTVESGVPSAQTLSQYDMVIWMHSGCSSYYGCWWGNPDLISADSELSTYLEGGGRLLISGQDMGQMDGDRGFFDRLLRADYLYSDAGFEGATLTGRAFLEGISLTLTNASHYGASNSVSYLSPDAVAPAGPSAYPVLTYASGEAAALAVAPCDAGYKAIYLAMGYENVGPRAQWQDPVISEVVARSVRWLDSEENQINYQMTARSTTKAGNIGQNVRYEIELENVGTQPVAVALSLTNNDWPLQILEDSAPVVSPLLLNPCHPRQLQIVVQIPADAAYGDEDSFTFTTSAPNQPDLPPHVQTFTTRVQPLWSQIAPMPTNRLWAGAAVLPETYHLYTIGGYSREWYNNAHAQVNERYDACAGVWQTLAPLPAGLVGASAGGIDGKIYVAGGEVAGSYFAYSASLYIYDPAMDTWSQGANLPGAQGYAASAVIGGKLYLFGGENSYEYLDHTLIYDPGLNEWSYGAPIPSDFVYSAVASALNGEIYVISLGLFAPQLNIYNPATNSWRVGAEPLSLRYGGTLVGASDGYLYFFGGITYSSADINQVERYHPPTNSWEAYSALQNGNRMGAVAGFVAGDLIVAGGNFNTNSAESLSISSSFCDSDVDLSPQAVEPGDAFTVTITIQPEAVDLFPARVLAPLPSDTTFVGFAENSLGASYNEAESRVEWIGSLRTESPMTTVYTLRTDASVQVGTRIQDEVIFETGEGGHFARPLRVGVYRADFSASSKWASASSLSRGEQLTYTVELLGQTPIGAPLELSDPLPATLQYLPGSLSASTGTASYDPATHTIHWQGSVQPAPGATINLTDDYLWGDSAGNGDVGGVTFAWTEIAADGRRVVLGDNEFVCDLDIGFAFPFYGEEYRNLCVHTDGYITFASPAATLPWICPLPTNGEMPPLIAALWSDLVVEGGVYAKVVGNAPNRRLILQWDQVHRYGLDSESTIDFQIVLSEDGDIQIHMRRVLSSQLDAVIGVHHPSGGATTAYSCNTSGNLHNRQAIRFLAPGQSAGAPHAQIQYGAQLASALTPNSTIINTAWISSPHIVYKRSMSVIVDPLRLGDSTLTVSKPEIKVNEAVGYRFHLRNSGQVTTTEVSLINALPLPLSYLPASLTCSAGRCGATGNVISWTGNIPPQQAVTVAYSATLTAPLADRTTVTNTAQLYDAQGSLTTLSASFVAQQAELSASFVEIDPVVFHSGEMVTYTIFLYNSGSDETDVKLSHALPSALTYQPDSVNCGAGQCVYAAGNVEWQGILPPRTLIPVRFQALVSPDLPHGSPVTSIVLIQDQTAQVEYTILASFDVAHQLFVAMLRADIWRFYLPWMERGYIIVQAEPVPVEEPAR
jgi:uncharacterized repeat protein (TIGR01451 family)